MYPPHMTQTSPGNDVSSSSYGIHVSSSSYDADGCLGCGHDRAFSNVLYTAGPRTMGVVHALARGSSMGPRRGQSSPEIQTALHPLEGQGVVIIGLFWHCNRSLLTL
jgi:hypothetical protein